MAEQNSQPVQRMSHRDNVTGVDAVDGSDGIDGMHTPRMWKGWKVPPGDLMDYCTRQPFLSDAVCRRLLGRASGLEITSIFRGGHDAWCVIAPAAQRTASAVEHLTTLA